jgi:hypothetical protein
VYVSAVEYYDTDGKLSKKPVDQLIKLDPLQTIEFLVERHDVTGGSGANFIVEWHRELHRRVACRDQRHARTADRSRHGGPFRNQRDLVRP